MLAYTTHRPDSATRIFAALGDLYAVVYAEPPYREGAEEINRFRTCLPDQAARPGFTLITAEDDGDLVGATYGWTMPAGTWWSRADTDPPAEVHDADKIAVLEWIVHPQRRGQGIGAALMSRLLRERSEPYATLASDPRSRARAIYARNGWRQVARSTLPWGPPMDLLVLDLRRPTVRNSANCSPF
ncbi:GNAT family N-acetyltransferase [Micromonospora mirobrigensis]|uniref:Acetyltransferase (GNAT) domain-containing protein n=1 Tax=Micromonospora mirobrigensis TaxID=262898 RepID=A0A1C5AGW0_9ACTN|nr:GNAT family N-acetyltransferase [Micromonospora mirobrigensis]SCF44492.1 Acetyltransferase (GNAT) domain-containing protein [Micromonospora mirobrigensis]